MLEDFFFLIAKKKNPTKNLQQYFITQHSDRRQARYSYLKKKKALASLPQMGKPPTAHPSLLTFPNLSTCYFNNSVLHYSATFIFTFKSLPFYFSSCWLFSSTLIIEKHFITHPCTIPEKMAFCPIESSFKPPLQTHILL